MTKFKELPSLEQLNNLFELEKISKTDLGVRSGLVRKTNSGPAKKGSMAGYLAKDSVRSERLVWKVKINSIEYRVHRIVYKLYSKKDPGIYEVDHKDRNTLNNNVNNLRIAEDKYIQSNNRGIPRNNKSKAVGVSWSIKNQKWHVSLCYKNQNIFLGLHKCLIEAATAYNSAVVKNIPASINKHLNDLSILTCTCNNCVNVP